VRLHPWRLVAVTLALLTTLTLLAVRPAAGGATFTDVVPDHPFIGPITWVAEHGLLTGYPDGTFRPSAALTRVGLVAALRRWHGPTDADPSALRFSDVATSHPFAADIAWAVEQGLVRGYPDGTFRPSLPVTRQAVAAVLWRYADRLTPGGTVYFPPDMNTFDDVLIGSTFQTEVEWANANHLLMGYGWRQFRPGAALTRQAAALVLQRWHARAQVVTR
jgi:hypothetical protein